MLYFNVQTLCDSFSSFYAFKVSIINKINYNVLDPCGINMKLDLCKMPFTWYHGKKKTKKKQGTFKWDLKQYNGRTKFCYNLYSIVL